jgi:Peptidase family M28
MIGLMNRLKLLLGVWILSSCVNLSAQEPTPQRYGTEILAESLKENLSIIASDAMEGRDTGKRGQKMAAAFIRAHFEELGLTGPLNGSYYQPVELYTTTPGETYVTVGNTRFNNFADVVYNGGDNSGGEVTLPLVFIGNASRADFDQVDVKDKAVLLLAKNESLAGNAGIVLARQKGAKMVLVCHADTKDDYAELASQIKAQRSQRGNLSLIKPSLDEDKRPGFFVVSPAVMDKFFGVSMDRLKKAASDDPKKKSIKKIKPSVVTYKTSRAIKPVATENVLGYLEGTDKKEELLIITAHYDHIGVQPGGQGDLINNGADDDGSGTVAVMEIAKVFAQAKKDGHGPRRSILFMTVAGEEHGLLGSEYYAQHPVFPLAQTVVDLNIDMIGRSDPQHENSAPYVYVIGADKLSTELNTVSESVNKTYSNLVFDYTYNDVNHPDRLYYRSDHWNFAKNNIPIIFYFDGIHEDYHRPSDEVEKIDFELLKKRTQCIFFTAWEIANRESRIMPDKK